MVGLGTRLPKHVQAGLGVTGFILFHDLQTRHFTTIYLICFADPRVCRGLTSIPPISVCEHSALLEAIARLQGFPNIKDLEESHKSVIEN